MKSWRMQKRGELRKENVAAALLLNSASEQVPHTALCWQPGAARSAYRSGCACGCPEAERAEKLSYLLAGRLMCLLQSPVHLGPLVPAVKESGHLLPHLFLLFSSHEELIYQMHSSGAGEAAAC